MAVCVTYLQWVAHACSKIRFCGPLAPRQLGVLDFDYAHNLQVMAMDVRLDRKSALRSDIRVCGPIFTWRLGLL